PFVSEFKIKPATLQLVVVFGVKAEQLGWAMAAEHLGLVQRDEEIEGEDFFAEVALVELGFEGGLVEMLELRQSELGRKQLEADGFVSDFSFEAGEGDGQDVGAVEGELGGFGNGEPFGVGGVGGGFGSVVREFDQGVISDTDDALAGAAMDGAEGVELFEEDVFQAGLFGE